MTQPESGNITRIRHGGYSIVGNAITRDTRVSMKARGIYFTVMSLPDDWDLTIKGLATLCKEKPRSLYPIMKELIDCGYATRVKVRGPGGKFIGYDYTFNELAEPEPEFNIPEDDKVSPSYQKTEFGKMVTKLNKDNNKHTYPSVTPMSALHGDAHGTPVHEGDPGESKEPARFDGIAFLKGDSTSYPPSLFPAKPNARRMARDTKEEKDTVGPRYMRMMISLCYLADTDQESRTVTSAQKSKISNVLGQLKRADADLEQIPGFRDWWKGHWQSKSPSGQYQPPKPEQVLEHWWVASKTLKPPATPTESPGINGSDSGIDNEKLEHLMKRVAKSKRGGTDTK